MQLTPKKSLNACFPVILPTLEQIFAYIASSIDLLPFTRVEPLQG
jgi:hypothetical protein